MATPVLDFEKPLAELEQRIDDLKRVADDRSFDVQDEIAPLERKLSDLRVDIYRNLTPMQRVQVARHPRRPFTLDYVRMIFTDWVELHGDLAVILRVASGFEVGHDRGAVAKIANSTVRNAKRPGTCVPGRGVGSRYRWLRGHAATGS